MTRKEVEAYLKGVTFTLGFFEPNEDETQHQAYYDRRHKQLEPRITNTQDLLKE